MQPGPSHGMSFNFPCSSSFHPLGFYVGGVLVQPECLNLLPEKEAQSEPLPVLRVQTADHKHNRFHRAKGHLLEMFKGTPTHLPSPPPVFLPVTQASLSEPLAQCVGLQSLQR